MGTGINAVKVSESIVCTESYYAEFKIVETFESGGILRIHKKVTGSEVDYAINYLIGREKAIAGCEVDIMPTLHRRDESRDIIYPDAKKGKNPDLRINGILCEVENPIKLSKQGLKRRVSDGAKQADFIIVNLCSPIDINIKRAACKGRFIDYQELVQVEFRTGGDYEVFLREHFDYSVKESML